MNFCVSGINKKSPQMLRQAQQTKKGGGF